MITAIGDSWDLLSNNSVLPNPIIPAFKKSEHRSENEKKTFEEGKPDAIARLHKQNGKKLLCTIITGYGGPNEWIVGKDKINDLINECKNNDEKSWKYSIDTVKQAISIFGIKNIRVYVGGIPDFWTKYHGSLEDKARDMINPKWKK